MRFLIDADLPYSLARLVAGYGHTALHVGEVGMGGASDDAIAEFAKSERWAILTGDFDFADIRNYPPAEFSGIVVLVLTPTMVSRDIHALAQSFLERDDVVYDLGGKLAIVEFGRVRLRG